MLISHVHGGQPPMLLGLGVTATSDDGIKKLQVALVALSTATRNPAINPGKTDGVLANGLPTDQTMTALSAGMALISPHLPTWAGVSLSISLGVGLSTDTAKKAVLDYASDLAVAAQAAAVAAPYYTSQPGAGPMMPAAAQPWYTQWWGVGAIVLGILGVVAIAKS